jgi:hypothetical protein
MPMDMEGAKVAQFLSIQAIIMFVQELQAMKHVLLDHGLIKTVDLARSLRLMAPHRKSC